MRTVCLFLWCLLIFQPANCSDKSADSIYLGETPIVHSSHLKYGEFESTTFALPETASILNTAPPSLAINIQASTSSSVASTATEYQQMSKVVHSQLPTSRPILRSENDLSTLTEALGESTVVAESVTVPRRQGEKTEEVRAEATVSNLPEAITTSSVPFNQQKSPPPEAPATRLADGPRVAKQDNIPLGQCRDTRLSICKRVVPYRKTTLPNMVGDTTYNAVNRSLPFFQLVLKSQCNRRMLQLVCAILEPKCVNFRPLPPCRKFCRVATYGCGEYIPATLPISNVFSCERYPDSNDPSICVNLAKSEECMEDEFQCPDKSCIPKEWHCDGVRDCVFAVDESNCSTSNTACTKEEFQCDRKCVPGRWRCDGEKDCQDGTDEVGCAQPEVCGNSRFSCADGSGCIPRRWVCDGKAECRDRSDEIDCSQKECAKGDFRCKNNICIPSIWRCDGQDDCKDNSDEVGCGVQHGNFQHLNPSAGDSYN